MQLRSMSGKAVVVLLVIAGAVALAIGVGLSMYLNKSPQTEKPVIKSTTIVGSKRPGFSMKDVEGKPHNISEFDGQVLIVNFWATWCPPCRREIPAFIELQDTFGKDGFQVIGVAIDEKDAVTDYTDGLGVNYPVMLGNSTALKISAAYGNRFGQLPYSLIIDRKGIIRFIGKRELSFKDIEEQIKPLLK